MPYLYLRRYQYLLILTAYSRCKYLCLLVHTAYLQCTYGVLTAYLCHKYWYLHRNYVYFWHNNRPWKGFPQCLFIMSMLIHVIEKIQYDFLYCFFALYTDFENCKEVEDEAEVYSLIVDMIFQRLQNTYTAPFSCMSQKFLYYPRLGYEWAQQKWTGLWWIAQQINN